MAEHKYLTAEEIKEIAVAMWADLRAQIPNSPVGYIQEKLESIIRPFRGDLKVALERNRRAQEEIDALLSDLEAMRRRAEIAEALADFSPSPCGHSSQYAYSEDGGKNIRCLLCAEAELDRLRKASREQSAGEQK